MAERPPLTPADCDLRDFPRMMIDIPRLFASEFDAAANDTEWRCGVTLWLKSFHQVPAASLPDDDVQLAKLCGLGRDVRTWRKARNAALRGWVHADDGLLYHPVVAEIALEAWLEKLTRRLSSGAGNAERWGAEFDPEPIRIEIGVTAHLLAALNPKSRWLSKQQVMLAMKRSQRDTDTAIPPGRKPIPPGHPIIPAGSQEKGRELKEDRDANASPVGPAAPAPTELELTPPDEPGDATGAKPWERDAEFGELWDAATPQMRTRAKAKSKVWPDWRAARKRWGGQAIVGSMRAYLARDPDVGRTGGPGLHIWLRDKCETWIGAQGGAPTAAPNARAELAPWGGPAEVRAAVEWGLREYAPSYLARCAWRDAPDRALVTASPAVFERVTRDAGGELERIGVKVVLEQGKAA